MGVTGAGWMKERVVDKGIGGGGGGVKGDQGSVKLGGG